MSNDYEQANRAVLTRSFSNISGRHIARKVAPFSTAFNVKSRSVLEETLRWLPSSNFTSNSSSHSPHR